jgi:hypothetical protein
MKGDFTRDTFEPFKQFRRVLMQQGRVQLDADWNEQVAILLHSLETLTKDLIGPHGGPEGNCGFAITATLDRFPEDCELDDNQKTQLKAAIKEPGDFLIGPGNYYVDGILAENSHYVLYSRQFHIQGTGLAITNKKCRHLIYLDVWERHITHLEDESISEIALRGADTATRSKVVWQVRSWELRDEFEITELLSHESPCAKLKKHWPLLVECWQPGHRGFLRARAKEALEIDRLEPSAISPDARFHGPENQLYRVEIHDGGVVDPMGVKNGPTFKWSRENGCVTFPVVSVEGSIVTLGNLGRDARFGVNVGDWVEIVDDDYVLQNRAEPLLMVEKVDSGRAKVTLKGQPVSTVGQDASKHPLLRRWDQKSGDPKRGGLELRDGAGILKEGEGDRFWLGLEDGVQIQFEVADPPNRYRTGDYWLIPARTATGDVEWPRSMGKPTALPPRGVEHHYAPLAIASFKDDLLETRANCRTTFRVPSFFAG